MSVELHTGCVASGKSSALVSRYVELTAKRTGEFIALKPEMDTRDLHIASRTGVKLRCTKVASRELPQYWDIAYRHDGVLVIDEAQFLGKEVVALARQFQRGAGSLLISMLDLDSDGNCFGCYEELEELSTLVVQHRARCEYKGCGMPATRTYYDGHKDEVILVGSRGYQAMCYQHWLSQTRAWTSVR